MVEDKGDGGFEGDGLDGGWRHGGKRGSFMT